MSKINGKYLTNHLMNIQVTNMDQHYHFEDAEAMGMAPENETDLPPLQKIRPQISSLETNLL